jgi:uncharacterized protein YlxW (UPF0749 family)
MSADQRAGKGTGQDTGRAADPAPAARSAPDDVTVPAADVPAAHVPAADVPAAHVPAPDVPPVPEGATAEDATSAEATPGAAPEAAAPEETPRTPDDRAEPAAPAPAAGARPRRRRGRDPLAAVLIGVLTLLLGFAFAVQVRSTDTDQALTGVREEDLVRILDDLTAQQDRLRQEIADQRAALDQLGSSDSASAAALKEARDRAAALGILNGSVAAQGPGITLTIRDPEGRVSSSVVLGAIEELRGAGAETMQVDDVRIGVSSAVTGTPRNLEIDGHPLQAPYTFQVIGSPQDMATAMSIPGGVVSTVGGRGGSVEIVQSEHVVVDALRPLDEPQYAQPDNGD